MFKIIALAITLCSCAALQEPPEYLPNHRQNDEGLVILSTLSQNESTWGMTSKHYQNPRPYLKVRVGNDSPFDITGLLQCEFYLGGQLKSTEDAVVVLRKREVRSVLIWYQPRRWRLKSICKVKVYRRTLKRE